MWLKVSIGGCGRGGGFIVRCGREQPNEKKKKKYRSRDSGTRAEGERGERRGEFAVTDADEETERTELSERIRSEGMGQSMASVVAAAHFHAQVPFLLR